MPTHLAEDQRPPEQGVYQPAPLLRWLYRRFFSHIHVDERWSAVVRESASRGVVVYVMRSLSILDFLCLDFLTKRFGLPLVRFVNDLGLWILEPFGKGERKLRLKRRVPEDEAVTSVVRAGHSALLFLRKPPRVGSRARRGEQLEADLIRSLVAAQRSMSQPILLVPQTFVWSKLPSTSSRGLLDLVFGTVEYPGKIRVFFQFLLNFRNALLRSGEAFDLAAFLQDHPDLTDEQAADKVRYAVLRRIEREQVLVLGPAQKTPTRITEELLRSPRVRKQIEAEARASKRPVPKVESEARRELDRLCANQSPYALRLLARVLNWVWTRIYDGMVIDEPGIERVRAAAREGALVFLPSHKSHVDYLVLSYVLYERALKAPLIAAGENLSFFPLGPLLRRGGAFFIKRSFQGKRLYAALVDAYMRKLLVDGNAIEFFIEGGRSRTGKLLPPKFGLLSMVVDAAMLLGARKVFFVPVSIGYERVIEERSYVHELSGGEKQTENVGDLLRTSSVLASKYGRVFVQFGEILSFGDLLAEAKRHAESEGHASDELSPRHRRQMIQGLAHRVTYQISQVTVVTPAALVASALLVHRRRGMTHTELRKTASDLLATLDLEGARVAGQVRSEDGSVRDAALREAIALFVDGRLVLEHETGDEAIYKVLEERRLGLEYYKNNLLHFFVPRAILGAALLADPHDVVPESTLRASVLRLARAFKNEFAFGPDADVDHLFSVTLAAMLDAGELERDEGGIRTAAGPLGERVAMYARMLGTYFEAYVLALRSAALLFDQAMPRKEWFKKALALGQRMYLAGEIERRESLSQLKLETALKAMRDHELVAVGAHDVLSPGPKAATREDLRSLELLLLPFLRI